MTPFREWLADGSVVLRVEVDEEYDVTTREDDDRTCDICDEPVAVQTDEEDPLRRCGVVFPRDTATAMRVTVRYDGDTQFAWGVRDKEWCLCCPDCLWEAQVLQREHAQMETLEHLQLARESLIRCGSVAPSDSLELQKAGLAVDTARKAVGDIGLAPTIDEQLEAS